METQTVVVQPQEDRGVTVYSATQSPDYVLRSVSMATGLPHNLIRVETRRLGGAYGGKITRFVIFLLAKLISLRSMLAAAAASAACVVTGQPVRMQMNLNTNMVLLGKRNPFEGQYEVEVDSQGKLQSVKLDYYIDVGSASNDSVVIMEMAFRTCDNAYYSPSWHITPHFALTNTPANTSARAPGCLPAIFIMETIMDNIASALKLSPDAVRFANLYQQGQVTPYHQPLPYCRLTELWTSLVASSNYNARASAVQGGLSHFALPNILGIQSSQSLEETRSFYRTDQVCNMQVSSMLTDIQVRHQLVGIQLWRAGVDLRCRRNSGNIHRRH
jgi:xanthine dehydrogenase/oxidase